MFLGQKNMKNTYNNSDWGCGELWIAKINQINVMLFGVLPLFVQFIYDSILHK